MTCPLCDNLRVPSHLFVRSFYFPVYVPSIRFISYSQLLPCLIDSLSLSLFTFGLQESSFYFGCCECCFIRQQWFGSGLIVGACCKFDLRFLVYGGHKQAVSPFNCVFWLV